VFVGAVLSNQTALFLPRDWAVRFKLLVPLLVPTLMGEGAILMLFTSWGWALGHQPSDLSVGLSCAAVLCCLFLSCLFLFVLHNVSWPWWHTTHRLAWSVCSQVQGGHGYHT
jgi:hypothetical protein